MKRILAAPPELAAEAAGTGLPVALMSWRVSRGFRLVRMPGPVPAGAVMAVDLRGFSGMGSVNALAEAIRRERRFQGPGDVLLDAGEEAGTGLRELADAVRRGLGERKLYLSEALAASVRAGTALVETAVSGGTLRGRLEEAAERFTTGRLALDVRLVRWEFTLPDRAGRGRPLTEEALRVMLERLRPRVFFSRELCANYFTRREGRDTFFVLFDDAATLRQKLALGERLGIGTAFLYYPEVRAILPRLISEAPPGGSPP